jgi:hypothetical protein
MPAENSKKEECMIKVISIFIYNLTQIPLQGPLDSGPVPTNTLSASLGVLEGYT